MRRTPSSINRIRLEFKDWNARLSRRKSDTVLIESDWNLKQEVYIRLRFALLSINRIRLEFKGHAVSL